MADAAPAEAGPLPAEAGPPPAEAAAPPAEAIAGPSTLHIPHSRVAAPMVGCSDLAFRQLCRRYGADLAYTEMYFADRFVADEAYRHSVFHSQLAPADRPLVVQFGGSDAPTLVAAALLAEPHCDAVDLNLGCPQKRAREGLYGAYLCDREHWARVFNIVRSLCNALSVPVFCKIRLLPTLAQTIRFARGLQAAGCSLLAVHARPRGSETRRRAGAADLSAVRAIKRALKIAVVTNGNVRRASDVAAALRRTRADGAMVAEPLLRFPALLHGAAEERPSTARRLGLMQEYLALAELHPPPDLTYAQAHLSWMLGRDGAGARLRYKHVCALADSQALRAELRGAASVRELREMVARLQRLEERAGEEQEDEEDGQEEEDEEEEAPDGDRGAAAGCTGPPLAGGATRAFWTCGVITFEHDPPTPQAASPHASRHCPEWESHTHGMIHN